MYVCMYVCMYAGCMCIRVGKKAAFLFIANLLHDDVKTQKLLLAPNFRPVVKFERQCCGYENDFF
jgi:hypothetical protein